MLETALNPIGKRAGKTLTATEDGRGWNVCIRTSVRRLGAHRLSNRQVLEPHLVPVSHPYTSSHRCNLPAVFVTEPEDVFAAVGNAALFNCSVTASNPVSITWLKDGVAVIPGSRFSYLANNSLLIEPIQQGDDGEYSCRVTDSITQEAEERSGTLTVACEETSCM